MRKERHDRHQRERRMQPAAEERDPRNCARANEIRPEAQRAAATEPPRDSERCRENESELQWAYRSGWIEDGEDEQAERIVRDREQQEKWDDRMLRTEDQPSNQVAEGDVRGARDRPAAHQLRRPERHDQTHVDEGRSHHSTHCRHERDGCSPGRVEGASRGGRFHYFLRGQREEERHAHIVHAEVKRVGNVLIVRQIYVGPDHPDDGAGDEQSGVVDETPHR